MRLLHSYPIAKFFLSQMLAKSCLFYRSTYVINIYRFFYFTLMTVTLGCSNFPIKIIKRLI